MILYSFYAAIATLGFSVLMNIKGKMIVITSIGGGITWLFYLLMMHISSSNLISMFVASMVAGIYSEVMARLLKCPVTTFAISAIIPLVPGGGMYNTMLESVQGNINNSLSTGLQTLLSAGAIAVAILLVSSITKIIIFWSKKIKTSRIA